MVDHVPAPDPSRKGSFVHPDRIWHPYTRAADRPPEGWPVLVRGEGLFLFDEAGRRYMDAISSWWACALGHSHPRLAAVIAEQAARLQHAILGNLSHRPALDLADALCALMPTPDRRVQFASDGSSAVEIALKVALQYNANRGRPGKSGLVSLEGAYHGDTLGAMAVGYQPSYHAAFRNVLFHAFQIPFPVRAEQEAGSLRAADEWLAAHADETAAVIVEPLCQGAAGMRMYTPGFLAALAGLCRTHDVLLIADEIAMGFGRTGRMFAFEHAGVDPDLVCVGKALSGGALPISAVIVRDAVYAAFDDDCADHTFSHGHTFAGNPIACAAALEALRLYREEDLAGHAARLGEILRRELDLLRGRGEVADVRCLGLIGAVEFRDTGAMSGVDRARNVREILLRRGILTRPLGPVLYLMPPLIIQAPELVALAGALSAALRQVGSDVPSPGEKEFQR